MIKFFKYKKYFLVFWLIIILMAFSFYYSTKASAATSLASRLQGYILLQVESVGEAWYVIPKDQQRVYMQNGSVAYEIMRYLSLGIKDSDLKKIPVGVEARFNDADVDQDGLSDNLENGLGTNPNKADTDNDGFSDGEEIKNNYNPLGSGNLTYDTSLITRLKGYILLQVEKQGQAWYLNPKDGKRYYMQDGPAAYQIMRYLSLGITNQNLSSISISSKTFNVDTDPPTNPPIIPPVTPPVTPTTTPPISQNSADQSIIFLHHSTGANLYNSGNVASWFASYNASHDTDYSISEMWYPTGVYNQFNDPINYYRLWVSNLCANANYGAQCLDALAATKDVVVLKHCYTSANIVPDTGNPQINSATLSQENYKLQYRALRDFMDARPSKLFIILTLPPRHRLASVTSGTAAETAARATAFSNWVKNTWLTEDAKSHPNIKVFDLHSYLIGTDNFLRYEYEASHTVGDSHPNSKANQTLGPLFGQFIVDATAQYFD